MATQSSAARLDAKPRGSLAGVKDVAELLGCELLQLARVTLGFVFFLDGRRVRKSRSDTKRYEGHGYLVWALALWMFAVPELYGSIKHENGHIPTLSNTVGNLINAYNWVSVFVVRVLFLGVAHIAQVQVPKRRPNASFAPFSQAGPTARSTGQASNAPQHLTAGFGTTTIDADTQPSATKPRSAELSRTGFRGVL